MLLMTTVDDLPAEGLPYIMERVLDAGANNIHVVNAFTKKGRMEYIIWVDVDETRLDDISSLLGLEFGTLGMKILHTDHLMLPFEIKSKTLTLKSKDYQSEFKVRIKYLKNSEEKVKSLKAEYEDIKSIATVLNERGVNISLSKLKTIIEAQAYNNLLNEMDLNFEIN